MSVDPISLESILWDINCNLERIADALEKMTVVENIEIKGENNEY